MSKHFSIFQTDSQYQAAKDNLDYPYVSLIDTTGDLHYVAYPGQKVADAPFGSILMAEVATNKLFYIDNSEYNLTDYPFADYKPIAVCIFDKASNANDLTVFMSVQWADYTDLGTPKRTFKLTNWGFYNVDLSANVSGIRDKDTNHVSSISINNAVKPLITMDYSGSSILNSTGNGESPAFCSCFRFKTAGTHEGDWYLPSYYDLSKYRQNLSTINNIFSNIKTIAGNTYLDITNGEIWSSTEASASNSYRLYNSNFESLKKTLSSNIRPVFIANIEEL